MLLGAGAAVDAGLPLTVELAERLVKRANSTVDPRRRRPDWISTLNFVYGAMVGYQAEDGGDPLQAVNIERLISALRLLENSAEHEVAPFVANWKPGALGIGVGDLDRSMGRAMADAVKRAIGEDAFFAEGPLMEAVAGIARSATTSGNPEVFRIAEQHVLEGLSEILGDIQSVEYLRPLVELANAQDGGLDAITLNYDLAVEEVASTYGVGVERGVPAWKPWSALQFPVLDGNINLLKLHGSLDWIQNRPSRGATPPSIVIRSGTEEYAGAVGSPPRPWIVVGEREKLATDGPTLALLQAAEEVLRRTTHLVVVGYSFGDAHVNALIRNWMLGGPPRTLGVVDVTWERRSLGEFRNALLEEYGADMSEGRESRIVVVLGTTEDRLAEALRRSPATTPEPYATALSSTAMPDGVVRIDMVLHGPDLRAVSINVASSPTSMGVNTFSRLDAVVDEPPVRYTASFHYASFDHWTSGSAISVYVRGPLPDGGVVSIAGERLDGAHHAEHFSAMLPQS